MKVKHAEFVLSAPSWRTLPPPIAPEVAFVGRSNVGKSSLLNALLGRKQLAKTSGTPGKTQALNFYAVNPNPQGHPDVFLVDLPGYGYAKVSQKQRARWQQFIGQYITQRAEEGTLRAVVQLIDSRHGMTKMDAELLAVMLESPAPHLIAMTKADKLGANARKKAVAGIQAELAPFGLELPIVLTSSEKKQGLAELWGWIDAVL
ncbi:ribosome biogenesis GTP-binding protein YihA/YsxC [Rubrivirga sp. IMCC45206]|uniref:ribosome biogenesis GTP-binding protein YihA/YsxC n=1 Tax=Rubrivirga sp. IMCC45206 TaxID=3391614 RepID=UPI0039901044